MLHRGLRYLRSSKISLQTLLAIPLMVQVMGTILIVDYFCYHSGQAAIEELVDQVVEDTHRRVVQTLDDYVHASETLVQGQRLTIQLGGLDWQNAALMEAYFVEQLQINPQVSGLMMVTEAQDFLAVGRLPAAPFAIQERNPSTGNLENYAADRQGKRLYLQDVVENYDPHVTPSGDPWYSEAQGQGAGLWQIASGEPGQDHASLIMTYVLPFTDAAGNAQGVLGASLYLDHMGEFLRSLPSSDAGRVFILDELDQLIATSTGEVLFRQEAIAANTETSSPEQGRLMAQDSQDPLTKAAALWRSQAEGGHSLKAQRVRLLEQTYFVQVIPFEVSPGLTWQVVMLVPEADLAGRIHASLRLTLWVSGLVLCGAVGVGLWAARRLTRSLLRLTQTAQGMEAGALELPLPDSRIAEVSTVSHALHHMHQQVQQSLSTLQDSEQKFATLLDSLPMGVGVLDGDGNMLLLNRMGHSIFQWGMVDNPLDSLEGYNIYLADTDQTYPPERRPVVRALQGETVYVDDLEVEVQGQRIPLEIKTAPVLNEAGEIIYVINAFQDISDRRQAEADRVAAQTLGYELRLLEQVLDVILAGYWDWNIPDHQEYLSPGFKRMFGYEDHELPNTPEAWQGLIVPEDLPGVLACFDRHIQSHGEEPFYNEVRYRHKDGSTVWVMCSGRVIEWDSAGQPLRMVGCHVDISDRKHLELELQESKATLQDILENAPAAIVTLRQLADRFWVTTYRSSGCDRVFGYSVKELKDTPGLWLSRVLEEDRHYAITNDTSLDSLPYHRTVEYRFRHKDGEIHWISAVQSIRWDDTLQCAIATLIESDITQSKRAELALHDSEARYRTLLETSPVGIFRNDVTGQCIYANPQLQDMTGRPLEDILGDGWNRNLHPEDQASMTAAWSTFVEQSNLGYEAIYQHEHRYFAADGSERWGFVQAVPEHNASGLLVGFVGSTVDITDRKHAEKLLQDSEARYLSILQDQTELIKRCRPDGTVLFINDAFCRYFGLTKKDVLDKRYPSSIYSEDRSIVDVCVASLSPEHPVGMVEHRVVTDRGVRWMQWTNRAIYDEQGMLIELQAVGRDIHDRKLAEERVRASEAMLLEAQQVAHIGNWMFDPVTQTITWSQELYRIFGLDPSQPAPAYADYLQKIHPDDRPTLIQYVEQAIAHGTPYTFDCRAIQPDGSIRYHEARGQVEQDAQGRVTRLFGTALDITKRKLMEGALQASESRFRAIFEQAAVGINQADCTGRLVEANQCFCAMLGYSRDELLTLTVQDITHPEDMAVYGHPIPRIFEEGIEAFTAEKRYRHKDGTWIWAEVTISAVRDAHGQPYCDLAIVIDICDRKQIEAELVHSRDFREVIFNESSDALFLVDLDTILTIDCNQRAVELFEASCKEDLLQIEGHRLQKRPFTESEMASLQQAVEQQGFWSLELEYITFQGREFWGDLSVKNITFGDQRFQLVRVADITDRKQAELALQRLHEEVRTFLDYAPALISLFDREGRYVRINPAFAQTLGRSESDIVGHTFEELFPDAMVMVFQERLQRLIVSQAPLMVEDDVELEGELRTFQSILFPVVSSGETNSYWAIATDITERKQMEQALQIQEQQFRGIFNSAVRFIGLLSPDGKFLDINHTALQLCPETRQDLMGVPAWDGAWFAPYSESQDKMREGVERASHGETSQAEILLMGIDQVERYVDVTFKPLLDPEGQVYQILAEGSDISDRKRAEMHLQEARIAAETANKAKSRFLANMSHELRTPLNAVLGYAQILMRDPDLAYQYQEYIQTIFSSGHHLLSLINDVLDLAKVESGHMGIDLEAVNLPSLLDSIYGLLRQEIRTRGLAFEIEADPRLPKSIITDGRRLKQVLINLLGNAIKFTPHGTITLRVTVGAAPSLSNLSTVALTFQVEDTGIGISPEDQQRIFEAFEQADAGRQLSGSTGLGLAISQQLVTLLGGHLQLCSEVSRGSTFQFTLVVDLAGNTSDGLTLPPTVTGLAIGQPPCRILVVDDQAVNRQFLDDALSNLGFEVYLARNGQEAIASWQAYQPDLILMDQRLPDFHGEQVTANIREWEAQNQLSATPIFMVSASSMENDRSGAIAAGCNAFLEKPIQIPELLQSIAQHLDVEFTSEEAIVLSDTVTLTLTPEDLKVMPLDWITQLYEAATQCRNDRIDQLIADIPDDYTVLKQALSDYNYNIQVDMIMDLSFACLKP